MSNELKTKEVYFKTYHADNHFLLAVLMKKKRTINNKKNTYYHLLICDSDIDKNDYPTFPAQQFQIDIERKKSGYKKNKYYNDLKKQAEEIHYDLKEEINDWLGHMNAKVTSVDSLNGMLIISKLNDYILFVFITYTDDFIESSYTTRRN